jgi:DUF971 family protein
LNVFVRTIKQRDNESFTIIWTDGCENHYNLAKLQQICPCASCRRVREAGQIPNNGRVGAVRIVGVGRYALRIQFTTGCSNGIYDFEMLRCHHENI